MGLPKSLRGRTAVAAMAVAAVWAFPRAWLALDVLGRIDVARHFGTWIVGMSPWDILSGVATIAILAIYYFTNRNELRLYGFGMVPLPQAAQWAYDALRGGGLADEAIKRSGPDAALRHHSMVMLKKNIVFGKRPPGSEFMKAEAPEGLNFTLEKDGSSVGYLDQNVSVFADLHVSRKDLRSYIKKMSKLELPGVS